MTARRHDDILALSVSAGRACRGFQCEARLGYSGGAREILPIAGLRAVRAGLAEGGMR